MKNKVLLRLSLFIVVFALVASGCQTAQPTTAPAAQPGTGAAAPVVKPSSGLIGTPERADQEYVWISNWSSLPMFVERVYPSLDAFARDFGVKVRKAGPTSDDLAAYITTVETECSRKPAPAGVIVVGGWDQSLQEPVNKCLAMKVPVVVTDGDLPNSKRLSYVGTNWYNLGVLMAKNQLKYHEERGLKKGKVAILTPLSYQNMMEAVQGIKDTLKGTYIEVLLEDSQADVTITTQKTSMVLAANPDLTGLIGLDSQAPMGIVTAVDEARKTGKIIITVNEAGLEFFQNIPNGKVLLITMEKYDVMEYIALSMLYMWHNDAIRPAGLDPWTSNWMPSLIDSGLIVVTKDNVAEVVKYYTEQQKASK